MSQTPDRAPITLSPAKLPRAPRSKRLTVPTAKARENETVQRTRRANRDSRSQRLQFQDIEDSDDDYEEENENTGNTLEDLLQLVKELKETIDQQNRAIQEAQAELKELREEQQYVKEQNDELKNEVGSLREQVNTLATSLPSTQTWATIAANRTGLTQSVPKNASLINNGSDSMARHPLKSLVAAETLCCTIDTSRVTQEGDDKTSPVAIRTIIEKEMRTNEGQSNWRCRAVTRDAKVTGRIKIACRNEDELHMVKQAVEAKGAEGIRVLRDELYPIKVDNVNRLAVLDEHGDIRAGAAEAFGQENETTVAKIGWLSKKDGAKAYGSMVVYLTKGSDASRLLQEGFFHVAGESGYAAVFERRSRPEQCYNCQEIGHKAFRCKNPQRCARCANGGHRHSDCAASIVKCVPCGGPHESFSRNCPKLYPSRHE